VNLEQLGFLSGMYITKDAAKQFEKKTGWHLTSSEFFEINWPPKVYSFRMYRKEFFTGKKYTYVKPGPRRTNWMLPTQYNYKGAWLGHYLGEYSFKAYDFITVDEMSEKQLLVYNAFYKCEWDVFSKTMINNYANTTT